MARSFSPRAPRVVVAASLTLLAAGCARTEAPVATSSVASAVPAASESQPIGEVTPRNTLTPALPGRSGELLNPDGSTMVLLYYDLAGIPAPIDQWLDDDMRVRMAPATQKPAARNLVRQELESGIKSVQHVGSIRLSMHANLSEYDATYGEFTVRALSPSSVVEFKAFGQKVALKFGNSRLAQTWKVPPAQAQGVRDRIGFSSDVSIDALLQIRDVHAAPEGGTITTQVIEYELRENRGGTLLGRVQLAQQP
ncbi:MAG: hypothetical protein WDO72_20140 [Pseudomonadota bacterium]